MSNDFDREIAIIKMARTLRQIELAKARKKDPKDGDGDGFTTNPVTGKDDMPVAVAAAMAAAGRSAKKVTAKKVTAKKVTAKKVTAKAKPAAARGASKVARHTVTEAVPGKMPVGNRVDKKNLDAVKKNPLFSMLFNSLSFDPSPDEPGSFETFRRHHHKRIEQRKSARGAQIAGGGTTFRRLVPAGHKKGRVEIGNGKYDAGSGMELNEVGAMGESLAFWNPDVRKIIAKRFGSIDHAEGQSLDGRVSNSTFDLFAGEYAIEVKTLNISANQDRYTIGKSSGGSEDPSHMAFKVKEAKKMGMKPALLIIMVDQDSGRVWMFADTNLATLNDRHHPYKKMEMLTEGKGLYVSQDVLYSSWLFGLLERPKRAAGTVKFDRTKRRVSVVNNKVSSEYGSEMTSTTIQGMLDTGYTSTGFT